MFLEGMLASTHPKNWLQETPHLSYRKCVSIAFQNVCARLVVSDSLQPHGW